MQATTGTPLNDGPDADAATAQGIGSHRALLGVWISVAALVVLLDQLSKAWAQHALTVGRPHRLLGDLLTLDLTHNAGAAFSVGTGYTIVLTVLAAGIIVGCIRLSRRLGSVGWAIALGLLLGGAVGNLVDRMVRAPGPFRGHVVDFVHLTHWPVFNLADASICVAAVLVVVLSLRGVRFDGSRDVGGANPS